MTVPSPASPACRPPAVLSVLVVAEDFLIQRLLLAALHKLGHATAAVDNGLAMLDMLSRGAVDVVLLDVSMPAMDGLAALATLRRSEFGGARRQRVVMLAGLAEWGEAVRVARADADGYLSKPLRQPALAAELARVMLHLS